MKGENMSEHWMNQWEAERIEYDFDLPQFQQKEEADKGEPADVKMENPALPGFESAVAAQTPSVKEEKSVLCPKKESDRQMNFDAILFAACQKER